MRSNVRRRILAIIIIGAAGVFPFALGANAAAPANDECEGAIVVAVGGSGTADNCEATDGVDDPEPSCAFGANFGSVYFKFVPTATSARIRTDLNSVAPDSDFAVYAVNQGTPCDETQWVEVGCAEDGDFKFNGDICIEGLVPGDTYKILLVSFSQASCGAYTVDIESPCPALAPSCAGVNDCSGNGVCIAENTCQCDPGFTGAACDQDVDDCAPDPCQNGGTCTDGVDSFTCSCPAGFTGVNCETNIDDCAPDPCQNGGTCTDGVDSFTCSCPAGFTGASCETNIDDCAPDPCQNGGTCTDGINSFTCSCAAGFTGATCETDIDECTTGADNCDVNATCTNTPGSFTCTCSAGYEGDGVACSDIDECATGADNCDANATCNNTAGGFECTCNAGFEGDGVTCTKIVILVDIDIKPGSDPNSINLSSAGVIPVAILSSPSFDAMTVNPDTIFLAGAGVRMVGKSGKLLCSSEDVSGDGLPDLVCKILTAEFLLVPGETIAVLEAQTFDGVKVRGQDSVRIVPE